MRNVIKLIFPSIIIVAVICFSLAMFFQTDLVTFINTKHVQVGSYSTTMYIFDLHKYLKNVEANLSPDFSNLVPIPPSQPQPIMNNMENILKTIASYCLYIVNWIICIGSVLILLPIKILIYPLMVSISILGINTQDTGILEAITKFYSFNFGYIEYLIPTA